MTNDNVNSPDHYKVGGIETIDFIEAKRLNYNLGNVVKYITRADHKANRLEDLQKAQWYLSREISNYPLAEVTPKVVEDKPNLYGRGDPRKVKGVKTHTPQRYGHNTLLALSRRNKDRMPAVGTTLFKAWQSIEDLLSSGPAHRKDLTATLEIAHARPNLSKYITIFLDRGLLKVVK
jgi:hypothetical protein